MHRVRHDQKKTMTNFRLWSVCDVCHKKKLLVAQRQVTLPMGQKATSHDYYCGKCNRSIQAAINNMKVGHE